MKKFAGFAALMALAATAQAGEDGWTIYGGVDYVTMEISGYSANEAPAPDNIPERVRLDFDTDMIRGRVGWWMNEDFALEAQFGFGNDKAEAPDTAEIDEYYGIYLVPRAQVFEWLDLLFPLGYATTDASLPDGEKISRDSASFGVNFQLDVAGLTGDEESAFGGLGVGAGFTVYHQGDDATFRGYNGGIYFSYTF